MNTIKNIVLIIGILTVTASQAQVTKVYIQASGLTCSMCSNAIYKALKKLDFVGKVDADVKNYIFEVSFKPGSEVDFSRIKNKVEDAGFSVSGFSASIIFNSTALRENQPVKLGNSNLLFVNGTNQMLNGEVRVKFLDKGFVSAKDNKSINYTMLAETATYHVTI